jgi:hypothetical protein
MVSAECPLMLQETAAKQTFGDVAFVPKADVRQYGKQYKSEGR